MLKEKKVNLPIKVLGIGHYVPSKIVTNHDMEKIVETSDEWITSRTGIKERRKVTFEKGPVLDGHVL